MKKQAAIINEDTIFNLKFSNIYAIIAMIVMLVLIYAAFDKRISQVEDKMNMIITGQKELSMEFRQWRNQAEQRLGVVESNQNQVISYVENHLQVKIVK